MTQPPGFEPGYPQGGPNDPGAVPPGQQPGYPPPGYPPPGYAPPGYPPPGYGYPPQPGYGYAAAAGKPSTNIGWAIAAIFTFWPLAIPAFIFSSRVDDAWLRGDRVGADSASRSARMFGLIAVIIGGLLFLLVIGLLIATAAFVTSTSDVISHLTPAPLPS